MLISTDISMQWIFFGSLQDPYVAKRLNPLTQYDHSFTDEESLSGVVSSILTAFRYNFFPPDVKAIYTNFAE